LLKKVEAKEGQTILEVAHLNDVEIEGACDAQLACSTCHVILDPKLFNSMEEASIREEDLLDLAYDLTPTSRLGCQVQITEDFEGTIIKLPKFT
jgi:ferredoxin